MTLVGISILKLIRRPASWVVLLVLLALVALLFVGLAASIGQISDPVERLQARLVIAFPNAYVVLVGIVLAFGGLLAIVYGSAISGSEWTAGTMRVAVARGESRIRYTVVTFLAIAIVIALGVLITFVIGVVLAVTAATIADTGTEGALDGDALLSFPDLIARTWLGVTQQAAIGFAVAMLFRSQLAGIGAGLAIYFGQIFLALVPPIQDLLPYFPLNVSTAVVAAAEGFGDDGGGGFGGGEQIDSEVAVVLAIVYMIVAVTIASIAAWRAQITQ